MNLKALLSNYDFGEIKSVQKVNEGAINLNFIVYCELKSVFVTLCPQDLSFESLEGLVLLMDDLVSEKIRSCQVLKAKDGSKIARFNGRLAYIKEYLPYSSYRGTGSKVFSL